MLTVSLFNYYNFFVFKARLLLSIKTGSLNSRKANFGIHYKDMTMKKLNASEVSAIVGGKVRNCVVSYETQTTGSGTTAVNTCRKVTTCNGKFGEYVTREPADLASCGL